MNSVRASQQRFLQILALITIVLIGIGAYVRTTGAGLSCPDWPLCFGEIVPEFSIAGVPQEVIHRYIASLVGFLCLVFCAWAYRTRQPAKRTLKFAIVLVILVIVQGVFGGLTVTMKLKPIIVMTHLGLGTLFFQLVALAAIERREPSAIGDDPLRRLALIAVILTFLQLLLGGYVAASGAALVCPGFPLCGGALEGEVAKGARHIHMTHRALALLLFLQVGYLWWRARRSTGLGSRRLGHLSGMLFVILLQAVVGVGNIHLGISPAVSILHLILAEILLLGLLSLWKELNPQIRLLD